MFWCGKGLILSIYSDYILTQIGNGVPDTRNKHFAMISTLTMFQSLIMKLPMGMVFHKHILLVFFSRWEIIGAHLFLWLGICQPTLAQGNNIHILFCPVPLQMTSKSIHGIWCYIKKSRLIISYELWSTVCITLTSQKVKKKCPTGPENQSSTTEYPS